MLFICGIKTPRESDFVYDRASDSDSDLDLCSDRELSREEEDEGIRIIELVV